MYWFWRECPSFSIQIFHCIEQLVLQSQISIGVLERRSWGTWEPECLSDVRGREDER